MRRNPNDERRTNSNDQKFRRMFPLKPEGFQTTEKRGGLRISFIGKFFRHSDLVLRHFQSPLFQIGAECGYDFNGLDALIRREETKVGRRLVHPPKLGKHRKHSTVAD